MLSNILLGLGVILTIILVLGLLSAVTTALYYVIVVKVASIFLKKETTEVLKTVLNNKRSNK